MALRGVLALDQGGHASRACVVSESQQILAQSEVAVATRLGSNGEVEQDAAELVASVWSAAERALRSAVAAAERAGDRLVLAAAGLATQRSTLVCFDWHSGAPLSAALSWQDRRNAQWLAGFESYRRQIRRITGLPLSPHYGVGKMRWCLERLPAVRSAARAGRLQIAPLAAYLAARLTESPARVDPANASRTLLWDSATHEWSSTLLELFGIDRALLPPCGRTRAHYGVLRPSIALPLESVPLRAVTGDQSAIPFAFGPPDPATVYINLGTGAFLQQPLLKRPAAPEPLLGGVLACDEGGAYYCVEGTVNGAGSAVSAFAADEGVEEPGLWARLDALPPDTALPVYVNGVGGLGSPYWREQRSYFSAESAAGQTLNTRFAAVVESVLFLIAANWECLRTRAGRARRVIVTGGLSRSDWLCRRLAALLEVPVVRGPVEATALGVAALAAPELPADGADPRPSSAGPRPARPARGAAPSALSASFAPDELAPPVRASLRHRRAEFQRLLGNG